MSDSTTTPAPTPPDLAAVIADIRHTHSLGLTRANPYPFEWFKRTLDNGMILADAVGRQVARLRELEDELSRWRPGDDGEPVTDDWLKSVGFVEQEGHLTAISPTREEDGLIVRRLSSGDWNAEDGFVALLIPTPKDRGECRRLCAALGIQLAGERTTKGGGGS